MTFIHGRNAAVTLDGRSLGAYLNSVTFTRTAEVTDHTPYGARRKVYLSGFEDGTAKLEGAYDSSATAGPGVILRPLVGGAVVTLTYRPEGTGPDRVSSTVGALVTQYEESIPVADMIKWTCDLQLSDDITDGVQATALPAGSTDGYGGGGYGATGYGE